MFNQPTQTLYNTSRKRGQWNQLRSLLTGQSHHLFNLADIEATCTIRERRSAGTQTVSISQIQGTENRSGDFDRDFNPLRQHNEQRWQKIAVLWLEGRGLPLLELVQVGDVYFVRDGHHRISVARALGQEDIEANVTIWQVDEPLPWQQAETTHSPFQRQTGKARQTAATRLQSQWFLSLSNWLAMVGHSFKKQRQTDVAAAGH